MSIFPSFDSNFQLQHQLSSAPYDFFSIKKDLQRWNTSQNQASALLNKSLFRYFGQVFELLYP